MAKDKNKDKDKAYKDYYYMRNGLLHKKFVADNAIHLSWEEENKLKEELTLKPSYKQQILKEKWDFLVHQVKRKVCTDGLYEAKKVTKKLTEDMYGCKN